MVPKYERNCLTLVIFRFGFPCKPEYVHKVKPYYSLIEIKRKYFKSMIFDAYGSKSQH